LKLAPIVLFVYNRPWHTRQTVEALQQNELANDSELFIFSDGAKDKMATKHVNDIRDYIRTIDGFKKIEIIERDKNIGLANSIISGVTKIINKYGKVIVLEDDLISSNKFLAFINQALDWYSDENNIFSVSGYNFPIQIPSNYKYDGYCSYRSMSWSWGTWLDKWEKADWEVKDYNEFVIDKNAKKLFNRGGDDLTDILKLQMNGKIDSWSIIWDYTHFKHNAFSFCPVKSKIYNIGFDGSGVHSSNNNVMQQKIKTEDTSQFHFFQGILVDDQFIKSVKKIHRYTFRRKIKKIMKTIMKK